MELQTGLMLVAQMDRQMGRQMDRQMVEMRVEWMGKS
jgi:hypothetical protein